MVDGVGSCEIECLTAIGALTIECYLIDSERSFYLETALDNRMIVLAQPLDGEILANRY